MLNRIKQGLANLVIENSEIDENLARFAGCSEKDNYPNNCKCLRYSKVETTLDRTGFNKTIKIITVCGK